jgi:hypothetical protein
MGDLEMSETSGERSARSLKFGLESRLTEGPVPVGHRTIEIAASLENPFEGIQIPAVPKGKMLKMRSDKRRIYLPGEKD